MADDIQQVATIQQQLEEMEQEIDQNLLQISNVSHQTQHLVAQTFYPKETRDKIAAIDREHAQKLKVLSDQTTKELKEIADQFQRDNDKLMQEEARTNIQ